jgi:hypothetical protein
MTLFWRSQGIEIKRSGIFKEETLVIYVTMQENDNKHVTRHKSVVSYVSLRNVLFFFLYIFYNIQGCEHAFGLE